MIIGLAIIAVLFLLVGEFTKANITIAPIIGVVAGFLYSRSDYDDAVEHTLQCCIFIVSITVTWDTKNG